MLLDARNFENDTLIQTNICIVGGGAAGIAIAQELNNRGVDVVLLESGGLKDDEDTQKLYDGTMEPPFERYDYCRISRCRYFGGTTNWWTGTCRPMDDIDFEHRPWIENSGWPIRRDSLDQYYDRAADILDCRPFNEHRGDGQLIPLNLFSADGSPSRIVPKAMFRSGPIVRLGEKYGAALSESSNIRVLFNSNLMELEANESANAIHQAKVAVLGGARFQVKADTFVLAAGGIENARLLLSSNRVMKDGLGNQHGNVGRYFMEHPRLDGAARLVWTTHNPTALINAFQDRLKATPPWYYTMYTPSHEMQRREQMLNCGMVLKDKENVADDPMSADTLQLATTLDGISSGQRGLSVAKVIPNQSTAIKFYIEQTPNWQSRIFLDDEVDSLGMRRPRIQWRIDESNIDHVYRSLELLGREVGRASHGRVQIVVDRDTMFDANSYPGSHPMGTTRMTQEPKHGVVDPNCRVHGLQNLYVAGSSVFPTGGFANPTLTLVALALRLADHLKQDHA